MATLPWLLYYASLSLKTHDRIAIAAVWIVGLFLQVATALTLHFTGQPEFTTPGFGRRAGGVFATPNDLYPVALITTTCFISSAATVSNQLAARAGLLLAALSGLAVVVTFSRAAWIGLGVLLLAVGWQMAPSRRFISVLAFLVVTAGGALVRSHSDFKAVANDRSALSRQWVWSVALANMPDHLLVGYGPGGMGKLTAKLSHGSTVNLPTDAKNQLVDEFVDGGLLGLAIFWTFCVATARQCQAVYVRRDCPAIDRAIAHAACLSLPTIAAAGIFDSPIFSSLDRLPGTCTFLVLVGMAHGISRDCLLLGGTKNENTILSLRKVFRSTPQNAE